MSTTLLSVLIGLELILAMVFLRQHGFIGRWSFNKIETRKAGDTYTIELYEVLHNGTRVKCAEMLAKLDNTSMIQALVKFLKMHQKSFYYLMFVPLQTTFLDRPFTLALVKQPRVERKADISAYKDYLSQCSQQMTFTFRSKFEPNTLLVCPCPLKQHPGNYADIATFLETAPFSQILALFKEIKLVTNTFFRTPEGQSGIPMFISTHGLEVPYLHVRMESPLPKHYDKAIYNLMP